MHPPRSTTRLVLLATALLALGGCSPSGDDATPATEPPDITTGGSVDLEGPPPTRPLPSGDAGSCPAAPFRLTVRTVAGETRTISAPNAYAVPVDNGASWRIVAGDGPLDAGSAPAVASGAFDPGGRTLVTLRLDTVGAAQAPPLQAGDTFRPVDPTRRPEAVNRTADLDVRTGADQTGPGGGLTGTVVVDAVTAEQVCLTVDLRRPAGAQAEGKLTARVVSPPSSTGVPGGGHAHGDGDGHAPGEEGHPGSGPTTPTP